MSKPPHKKSRSVYCWMRGEPKSGTTYVEYFVRSLLMNYCGAMGFDVKYSDRKVGCHSKSQEFIFDVHYKHDILTTTVIYHLFPPLSKSSCRDSNCLRRQLQGSALSYFQKLPPETKFLLVLREPLEVLQSRYFYVAKKEEMSQEGLDSFAMERSYETFANIASRYILHHDFSGGLTVFWYYESPVVDNVKSVLRLFSIQDEIAEEVLQAAKSMSSVHLMHGVEQLGNMPGNRAHEKVRQNHSITITSDVAEQILKSHKDLLPSELRERWYQ